MFSGNQAAGGIGVQILDIVASGEGLGRICRAKNLRDASFDKRIQIFRSWRRVTRLIVFNGPLTFRRINLTKVIDTNALSGFVCRPPVVSGRDTGQHADHQNNDHNFYKRETLRALFQGNQRKINE